MKKILFYASVACIIATFSSCSDNNSATPFVGTPGTIIGLDENECPEEVVYLTISMTADADAYQWYKDGVAIDGATASTYVVTESGTYSVAGVNAAGTGTPSAGHVVTIVPCSGEKPETPTIQGATENVCPDVTVVLTAESEGATSYQWYKDAALIDDATAPTYEVTESGTYTVIGVNDDGEGEPSAEHVVTITTCEEEPTVIGSFAVWSWNFFDTDAYTWNETIEEIDETTFKCTNFGNYGDPYYIYKDNNGYYIPAILSSPIGTFEYQGNTYDVYQVTGGYTDHGAQGVYMANVDIPLEFDGNNFKLPATIQYNGNTLIPAIGTRITMSGTDYWLDCFGEVTWTKTGNAGSSSMVPRTAKSPSKALEF
jgi:hypothetical protein